MIMGCKCCKGDKYIDDDRNLNNNTTDDGSSNHITVNDPLNNIPNDNKEMSPSQMLHYTHRYIWQGNFSSPVEERLKAGNARILNVGCGEGAWVLDNASRYEASNFSGCDTISFPYNASKSNYLFLTANILERLPYDNDAFDFVFLGFGSFTENEWREKVVRELVRVCKPGGWIEIMDCENKFYKGGKTTKRLEKAYQLFLESSKQIDYLISPRFEEFLDSTNKINNIQREEKDVILGNKGGRTGKYLLQDIVTTWQRPKVLISEFMGITVAEYDKLIQTFPNEVNELKTSIKYLRVYGQKNNN